MSGGAIPASTHRLLVFVDFRQPVPFDGFHLVSRPVSLRGWSFPTPGMRTLQQVTKYHGLPFAISINWNQGFLDGLDLLDYSKIWSEAVFSLCIQTDVPGGDMSSAVSLTLHKPHPLLYM